MNRGTNRYSDSGNHLKRLDFQRSALYDWLSGIELKERATTMGIGHSYWKPTRKPGYAPYPEPLSRIDWMEIEEWGGSY